MPGDGGFFVHERGSLLDLVFERGVDSPLLTPHEDEETDHKPGGAEVEIADEPGRQQDEDRPTVL